MKKSEIVKLTEEITKRILKENVNHSPIHLWVYFGYNFPQNFIEQAWKGNEHMIKHLTSKFKEAYSIAGSKGVMNYFYTMLDEENTQILENWVLKNYKG